MYSHLLTYGHNITQNEIALIDGLLSLHAKFWRPLTVSNFEIANLKNRVRKNIPGKNDVNVMYGAVRSDQKLYSGPTGTYERSKILTKGLFEAGLL